MHAVTIKEAKAHLNKLIDAAVSGEHVVLMRGSKHVAAIVPVSADDLELCTTMAEMQAERFWKEIAVEREQEATVSFPSAEAAVQHLEGKSRARKRR